MLKPSPSEERNGTPEAIGEDVDEQLGQYIPPELRGDAQAFQPTPKAPRARETYTNPPPWTMSLGIAAAGVFVALLLIAYPSLRRLPMPFGTLFFTPYLAVGLPLLSASWAITGMTQRRYRAQMPWCLAGLFLAALGFIAILSTFWTDPSRW